jgi:hypothetical protein
VLAAVERRGGHKWTERHTAASPQWLFLQQVESIYGFALLAAGRGGVDFLILTATLSST